MKSFVNSKILVSAFFTLVFSLSIFSNVSAQTDNLNLTSEYSNNPSTNPDFQIVPDCSRNVSWGNTECGWTDLLQLVRNIMTFMLFISAIIAVISFIYAGFLYMTSFGDMGKVEKAHGIFSKVIIGFLFVFLGWLIVATILKTMGIEEGFSLLNTSSVTEIKENN